MQEDFIKGASFIHLIIEEILLDISSPKPLLLSSQGILSIIENPLLLLETLLLPSSIPNLLHIRVKKQFSESLCGFHALFYAKTFIKAIKKAKKVSEQMNYLGRLNSNASFWRFYIKTLKKLVENPLLDPFDLKELLLEGPLDPSHLELLLSSGFLKDFPKEAIGALYYGYGYFQCSLERVLQAESLNIVRNPNNKEDWSLYFLGVTSHWMVYFRHKTGISVLFDSRVMEGFLDLSIPLERLLEIEEKERVFFGKSGFEEKERKVFIHNIRDGRFLMKVLKEEELGNMLMKEVVMNRSLFDVIRSFELMVYDRVLDEYFFEEFSLENQVFTFEIIKEEDYKDEKAGKLLLWLKKEKPPRVLKEDLVDVLARLGPEALGMKSRVFMKEWIKEIRGIMNLIKEKEGNSEDIEVIKGLKIILEELEGFIKG